VVDGQRVITLAATNCPEYPKTAAGKKYYLLSGKLSLEIFRAAWFQTKTLRSRKLTVGNDNKSRSDSV
jgi:hypothetical protein